MQSPDLKVGAFAALYVLWLGSWLVLGDKAFGACHYNWDEASVAAAAAVAALLACRRVGAPYRGFLALQGVSFLLLAVVWLTYGTGAPSACAPDKTAVVGDDPLDLISDAIYAFSVFALLCAWSCLALLRWRQRQLSPLTLLVFVALMAGLGAIFASFYYQQYAGDMGSALGRLDGVTAALEYLVLVTGLLCMLLKERGIVVWMLVGTVVLMASDMAYSVRNVPELIDAVWMFGQFLILAAMAVMPGTSPCDGADPIVAPTPDAAGEGRSGLSGVLILISLGAALLSPLVWLLPVAVAWKSLVAVLFVVALVMLLVWITDRFDDTVTFLREYVARTHRERLASTDWHAAPPRIRAALASTGLGAFLDDFRASAARLRGDVLFLGRERLFGPPVVPAAQRKASCFIVMPFSEAWSGEVHRVIANTCVEADVRAVRGDDLFTPTDILDDIWNAIHAADFIVADITGRNPNVLYELGIAHTLAKPVLILSRNAADIPIDLATRRVILYGQSADDWREDLTVKISRAVRQIITDYGIGGDDSGPVTDP